MRDRKEKWARIRIRMIGGVFIFFFAITSARAFYLQIIKKEQLVRLAERQHQKIVALTPARGTIYDRNNAPLAVSIEMDSCFAEPRNIDNINETAARLAPLFGISRDSLAAKLNASKNFVWLDRRMPPDQVQKIKTLDLDGIGFVKETKRFYPNGEVAGHVIGFTGLDPDGLEGIELKYNSTILGSTGYLVTERDALGRDIAQMGTVVTKASKGQNVTLTLDKNIQYITEKELAKAVTACGAKGGMAIVMEPRTGQVLAMANYPGFNPNAYSRYSPQLLRNKTIVDSFEPGSTFKAFLISAALEERVVTPGDAFNCENGSYAIGGRVIHDTHKYGRLTVSEILKYSSNIGASKIGARLGQERLYSHLKEFGFGAKSGVDLPGEAYGYLREGSQWFGVELATISFGQGVSATALQVATAISAIANGGLLMKPYLVEKITDENGAELESTIPQVRRRVISPETAATMTRMMEGVTSEGGTGMNANVEGYRVAGKTGTAQKVDPVTRGYSADKRVASFVGFVPADNPRLTIFVVIDEPRTSPYGGVVAAPAFSAIAQQTLCYLKVPPDREIKPRRPETVEAKAAAPADVTAAAAEGMIDDATEGTVMPNFRGMSMREVLRTMEKNGLNVKLEGSGRAVEQSPLPGHRIGPADRVWVKFAASG
ncbi:MAG TPA: penicillin-binding protein [Geobacteraceae bacterium]|nr:penicillin-binding protein [Geobacteraceae bacterium]